MAALAVLSVLWQPALAEDPPAKVVAALGKIIPDVDPDRIERSAIAGLFEVSFGAMVVYVSEDGRYLIRGDMVNLDSGKNYTRERRREHRRESMATVDADESSGRSVASGINAPNVARPAVASSMDAVDKLSAWLLEQADLTGPG